MLSQSHIRGLLQSLDFSEGTGTTLNDKSGNGNNATIVGGTWTADRFGRANRAVEINGTDSQWINLGLDNYQGELSILISSKFSSDPENKFLLNKGYTNGGQTTTRIVWNFVLSVSKRFAAQFWNGTLINTQIYNAQSWTLGWDTFYGAVKHVTAVNAGSNGRQISRVNLDASTEFSTGQPIRIGRGINTGFALACTIDRIMLFNRFLSGYELSKLANRLKIGDLDK